MKKISKSKRVKLVIAVIFIIICFFGLIYASFNMIIWKKDVNKNSELKQEINNIIEKKKSEYNIDFASLKEKNSDTVGYIKVENTNIDYVVVKGNDNKYYLNHDFNKESNIAGWIFADYNNRFDGTDNNIVIYGHNTRDGSMFGTLNNTLETDWQSNKDNYTIVLVTERGEYKYRVFSTYEVEPEDYYIRTHFNDDDKYINFLNEIKSRSNYDYNVELSRNDKILTLSSCSSNGKKRVVLHAKLITNNK